MATFLDMQTRIADELHRTDLTDRIKLAILSAVAHYERRRFYFSETSFTFSTVAHQEFYGAADNAAIATSPNIERLNALYFGTRYPLDKVDWMAIDDKSALATSYTRPGEWGYRAKAIRFYPIPDAAYVITAYNVPRLTALSAEGDENAWTDDAEELIRLHAKRDLIMNQIGITGREKEYGEMGGAEQMALAALIAETTSREATGQLQPTQF